MVRTRADLISLLTEGALVEHSLAVQYLFAAFSMKADVSEGVTHEQMNLLTQWERFILMVARQEMEHLGLVCNLLTAIGGAPQLSAQHFPYPTSLYGHQMALERFSKRALQRFVCFERPEDISHADAFCLEAPDPSARSSGYKTVGELYRAIRQGFIDLSERGEPLFIGAQKNQLGGKDLNLDFQRVRGRGGVYDVFLFTIGDLETALRAVDLIIEQGEGNPHDGEATHYRAFLEVLEALTAEQQRDPAFEPARPVVENPSLSAQPGAHVVTHPLARGVMQLFDDAYQTMLFMLIQLYAHTNEVANAIAELKSAAFFPFMTMVIRPLSELLTAMPAHTGDANATAGPAFALSPGLAFLPHPHAAWFLLGERLEQLTRDCKALSEQPGAPRRLAYIAESFQLITRRFEKTRKALP